jgi:AraC-like DNA-binding protein
LSDGDTVVAAIDKMVTALATPFGERRKSARLLLPFVRVIGQAPEVVREMHREGIGPGEIARPETRLSHRRVMELIDRWERATNDPSIGIRAGLGVEPGELETMELAARCCATFREGILCSARYIHLINEAADVSLVESGDVALWRFRVTDGVRQARAANDFVLACAAKFSRRYAGIATPPHEVHFMHDPPADLSPYARFRSTLRFGMPHNGFVFDRRHLDRPMARANEDLREAFETYARELSERLGPGSSSRGRVRARARDVVVDQLRRGEMCMEAVAASLAMSVPTLRRRLEDEGTTFSDLVDEIRRELAEQLLRDPRRTISEIAFMLGFSHAPAFHKAFRRWTGSTPSEHRAKTTSAVQR